MNVRTSSDSVAEFFGHDNAATVSYSYDPETGRYSFRGCELDPSEQPRMKAPHAGSSMNPVEQYLRKWLNRTQAAEQKRAKAAASARRSQERDAKARWKDARRRPLGRSFVQVMDAMGVHTPPPLVQGAIADWLGGIESGKPAVILSAMCPDYATATAPDGSTVYTFRGLNAGVGLVASRVLERIPHALNWIRQNSLQGQVRLIAAIGDMEGFSARNRARMNLPDIDDFMDRLLGSQVMFGVGVESLPGFSNALESGLVETPLFTQLLAGCSNASHVDRERAWRALLHTTDARMRLHGDCGPLPMSAAQTATMMEDRVAIYSVWHGLRLTPRAFGAADEDHMNPDDLVEMSAQWDVLRGLVREQNVEYAAMGAVADEHNALLLQADSVNQAPWWHGGSATARPVLHIRGAGY